MILARNRGRLRGPVGGWILVPRVDDLRLSDDDGVEKTFLAASRERLRSSPNRGRFEGDWVKPVARLN